MVRMKKELNDEINVSIWNLSKFLIKSILMSINNKKNLYIIKKFFKNTLINFKKAI
jgi:hypothetical protein